MNAPTIRELARRCLAVAANDWLITRRTIGVTQTILDEADANFDAVMRCEFVIGLDKAIESIESNGVDSVLITLESGKDFEVNATSGQIFWGA